MVLSSRLAKRIGVRRPNVPGGGPRRGGAGPVTDARQVLNARGLRNNLGRGSNPRAFRSTLRSDQLVATAIRGTNTAGPRFPKRQAQVATSGQLAGRVGHVGRVQTRQQGLVSATKRLAHGRVSSSLRLWALGHRSGAGSFSSQRQEDGDGIDDVFPQSTDKRIRVSSDGISVTTVNNWQPPRRNLAPTRTPVALAEDEDDLERMTLEDVLGKSPSSWKTPTASTSRLYRVPPVRTIPTMVSRIQDRLDGGGATAARRTPSEPLQGVSVLVANLHPQVTESDIRDLFQDIGPMQDVRMVGVGTALATFHRQTDAVKAFKAYHGRLLDHQPMNLTVLTLSTLQLDQR